MTIEKKNKLIYSGELIFFSITFLVLGILELLKVITLSDRFQLIFKIVTLVGATWLVTDFVWTIMSPKRKAKNCLLDKIIMLPLAVYLYSFDIAGFVVARPYEYYQIGVPVAFFYISCSYAFQGVYHYYKPIPLLLEAIKEEEEAKAAKEVEKEQEVVETPTQEEKPDPEQKE